MEDLPTLTVHVDVCCDVCGDIGWSGMLITCSCCKSSREHIYCMRICRDYPPEDWCCEECEHISATDSPTCGADLPKALPSNCSRRVQNDSARPNRVPNDPSVNCMDHEKKSQPRKVKPLTPQEVVQLNSRGKKFTSRPRTSYLR